MKKFKAQCKRFFVLLCVVSLMIPLFGHTIVAEAAKPKEGLKKVVSTTLPESTDLPFRWEAEIVGNSVIVNVTCPEASSGAMLGAKWKVMLNCNYQKLAEVYFPDYSGVTSVTVELPALQASGTNFLTVQVGTDDQARHNGTMYLQESDGNITFYSPYGQAAEDAIAYYNANFDPEKYKTPTYEDMFLITSYDEIYAKAQEITAGCVTDLQKIVAIYEWIARNFAYDKTASQTGNLRNAANIDWVYANKRAVCDGFSYLGEFMFRAVGIASIRVIGYNGASAILGGTAEGKEDNHSWNIVWCEGSWHHVDLTAACKNDYYGEDDPYTTIGEEPSYGQLGRSPELVGTGHYNSQYPTPGVTMVDLAVRKMTTEFEVGSEFVKPSEIFFVDANGVLTQIYRTSGIVYSGYDMNTLGTQTVTVSFKGFTTTYEIEVKDTLDGSTDGTVDEPADETKEETTDESEETRELKAITATKTVATYEVGGVFDKSDVIVIAEYTDGTTEVVTTGFLLDEKAVHMDSAGTKQVKVTYKGKTCYLAIEVKPHVLTFDVNGGTMPANAKTSVEVKSHNTTAMAMFPKPTRDGYTFDGWYTAPTGGEKVSALQKVTESKTIYAQWIADETEEEEAPDQVEKLKLKNKKKGQVKIKFQKVDDAVGYEIMYSTSEQFTKETTKIVTSAKPNKKIKKLTKNKTYYVKIRAYKTDAAGEKVYGEYSAVKSVKIKK